MWLGIAAKLVPGILKTGMSIAANRRKTKELESVAELKMAERMANGEVEFKKAVIDSHKGDWKDEFCLILISIPLLLFKIIQAPDAGEPPGLDELPADVAVAWHEAFEEAPMFD